MKSLPLPPLPRSKSSSISGIWLFSAGLGDFSALISFLGSADSHPL
jgi:hypothetical protein